MDASALMQLLETHPLVVDNEKDVQARIETALTGSGVSFKREVRLAPRDIIDFVVDRTGIEVKIKGGKRAIYRQIQRYAESDALDSIILLTNIATGMPTEINGKPVHVASIGRGWL
jgi:hypothetical protein